MYADKKILSIQKFIATLNENSIPIALLKRVKRGYSNKRIVDDYKIMNFNCELQRQGRKSLFLVPFCHLALAIGIGHGLVLIGVQYPKRGYFSDPNNSLDDTYIEFIKEV